MIAELTARLPLERNMLRRNKKLSLSGISMNSEHSGAGGTDSSPTSPVPIPPPANTYTSGGADRYRETPESAREDPRPSTSTNAARKSWKRVLSGIKKKKKRTSISTSSEQSIFDSLSSNSPGGRTPGDPSAATSPASSLRIQSDCSCCESSAAMMGSVLPDSDDGSMCVLEGLGGEGEERSGGENGGGEGGGGRGEGKNRGRGMEPGREVGEGGPGRGPGGKGGGGGGEEGRGEGGVLAPEMPPSQTKRSNSCGKVIGRIHKNSVCAS